MSEIKKTTKQKVDELFDKANTDLDSRHMVRWLAGAFGIMCARMNESDLEMMVSNFNRIKATQTDRDREPALEKIVGNARKTQQPKSNFRPTPLLVGKDIVDEFELESGPLIGQLIKEAYQAQLDGKFRTRDGGLRYVKENYLKFRNESI